MPFIVRNKETKSCSDPFPDLAGAKEYAVTHVENYKKGFDIIDDLRVVQKDADRIVYSDDREEVSRVDLIDLD